jgi:hypothetical protein
MANSPPLPDFTEVSLRSLKLRAGMFLQAEGGADNRKYEMHYLGTIEGKCLMIVPVGDFSMLFGMKAGEKYMIRGFNGQFDYRFNATVIQAFDFTFKVPKYAYAVLSYPDVVEARKVRNSQRIKTSLPAVVTPHGAETPVEVTVLDLSVEGALLRSQTPLGANGELVRLDFSTTSDTPVHLLTLARICHAPEIKGEEGYLAGVTFENISSNARITLKEFVLSHLE